MPFKTMIDQPLMAMFIVQMCEAKQITVDLAKEALADPKLAKMIVQHELAHWEIKHCLTPEPAKQFTEAMDIVIAATLEQSQ